MKNVRELEEKIEQYENAVSLNKKLLREAQDERKLILCPYRVSDVIIAGHDDVCRIDKIDLLSDNCWYFEGVSLVTKIHCEGCLQITYNKK